jgi:hypothetical protein
MTETGIQIFQAHGTDTNFGEKRLFLSKQVEGYEFEPVSVFGYELEPSYPSALREMVTRAPRKAVSWVQKTCRRRSLQLSAVESTVAAVQLVANHEENENDGCGAMTTYTAAPTKAKAFLGTPQFSTITPQQAMALYAKNHSSTNLTKDHKREGKHPLPVWRAVNRNVSFSNKVSAEIDDLSQNSATVGASKSFESGCSSTDGIEFTSHDDDKPLPNIC